MIEITRDEHTIGIVWTWTMTSEAKSKERKRAKNEGITRNMRGEIVKWDYQSPRKELSSKWPLYTREHRWVLNACRLTRVRIVGCSVAADAS
jgi:carboxylesterase type B